MTTSEARTDGNKPCPWDRAKKYQVVPVHRNEPPRDARGADSQDRRPRPTPCPFSRFSHTEKRDENTTSKGQSAERGRLPRPLGAPAIRCPCNTAKKRRTGLQAGSGGARAGLVGHGWVRNRPGDRFYEAGRRSLVSSVDYATNRRRARGRSTGDSAFTNRVAIAERPTTWTAKRTGGRCAHEGLPLHTKILSARSPGLLRGEEGACGAIVGCLCRKRLACTAVY